MASSYSVARLLVLCMCVVLSVCVSKRQVNVANIDAALRNPSFVRFQLSCLLERGSCDRIGQRIRSLLPEIVTTGECNQCTNHEINQAGKVMLYIQEHYPMEYDLLERKYTSENHLHDEGHM
ncbi:hypothetical protein CHUAL_012127 [Chamberlinius hualienensis]